MPFFAAIKTRNDVETFVCWAIQRAPVEGARQWVQANPARVKAFLDWAQAYQWPGQ